MRVRFWGTRGSIPKPGRGTVRYGGNTSCVEVRSPAGTVVVLDCGTGAHDLGAALVDEGLAAGRPVDGHLLIGHTHWDHIQGLPFFAPLFDPGNRWHVYGPRGLTGSLAGTLAGQMQYTYFPVDLDALGAAIAYHDLVEGEMAIDDVVVRTHYLNHPALTLGYRLEAGGVSVVYASDHEPHDPALAAGGDLVGGRADARHVEFLAGADLVIHDTQYLAEEYTARTGWGHSTIEYAVDAVRAAGAARLVLYHHDPGRHDDAVDEVLARARRRAAEVGYRGEVLAAAEGMEIELSPRGTATVPVPPVPTGRRSGAPAALAVLERLASSVVLAVTDSVVAGAVGSAAAAESMTVVEAPTGPKAAEAADGAAGGVLVVDVDQDRAVLDPLWQAMTARAGAAVLGLTRGRPGMGPGGGSVLDWLVWPCGPGHIRTKLRAAALRRACRWQVAPAAPDEARRIAALRDLNLLDTEPEERFDRLTERARQDLDAPLALITLVDAERQWFKSRAGPIELTESHRDQSLCAHAILGEDVFEVPDLLEDPRFADHPAATGALRVRYYAGAPLSLADGSRVGTLCIVDHRPRRLDDDQLERLRTLARMAEAELEGPPA